MKNNIKLLEELLTKIKNTPNDIINKAIDNLKLQKEIPIEKVEEEKIC